jgi:hypothetical protein
MNTFEKFHKWPIIRLHSKNFKWNVNKWRHWTWGFRESLKQLRKLFKLWSNPPKPWLEETLAKGSTFVYGSCPLKQLFVGLLTKVPSQLSVSGAFIILPVFLSTYCLTVKLGNPQISPVYLLIESGFGEVWLRLIQGLYYIGGDRSDHQLTISQLVKWLTHRIKICWYDDLTVCCS